MGAARGDVGWAPAHRSPDTPAEACGYPWNPPRPSHDETAPGAGWGPDPPSVTSGVASPYDLQAQGGRRRARNASTPSLASSVSHRSTSAATLASTSCAVGAPPRRRASALDAATAPGAAER